MDVFSTRNNAAYRPEQAENVMYKSVQAWKKPKNIDPILSNLNAQNTIISNLEKAANGQVGSFDVHLKTANAYRNDEAANSPIHGKSSTFGFADIVDIINPLQHIPLVNMAYRGITGDEIHPISQIIGGALYGGAVGAITGTANAITKVQTGKDIGDTALEFAGLGRERTPPTPEAQLNMIVDRLNNETPLEDLPGTAIAFANLAESQGQPAKYEHVQILEERTAGLEKFKRN